MRKNLIQLFFISFIFGSQIVAPSDCFSQYAKTTIEKLASPKFDGRGYYKQGDLKAAKFIRREFKKSGLSPVNGTMFQPFSFPVNTFPGAMNVTIGNKKLVAGKDYIVSPACPTVKGTFPLLKLTWPLIDFKQNDYSTSFILVDKAGLDSVAAAAFDSVLRNPPMVKGMVVVEAKKLTWSVSQKVNDQVFIRVLQDSFPSNATNIKLDIENKFISNYATQNVMALLPGTTNSDSFLVFTAHYDHLGRMGKDALFAGANDNASGTAMILDLAKYYSKPENRPAKSLLFIAFAGEEAGLVGSKFYTENPPLPLKTIRFLINLDLMGNGEEGLMVVNGEVFEDEFKILEKLMPISNCFKRLEKRKSPKQ
ncbi:MAG: M28 family peptidase [Bacteroidetes bacterium]|nr:M28 family peptidase [Bacteroidota bacterium]